MNNKAEENRGWGRAGGGGEEQAGGGKNNTAKNVAIKKGLMGGCHKKWGGVGEGGLQGRGSGRFGPRHFSVSKSTIIF